MSHQLLAAFAAASCLVAASATSQNLLTNGSFDAPAGALSGWGAFGNAYGEIINPPAIVPRSAPNDAKLFGNFSGGFSVSGLYQSFPAQPGQTYTLDCWSYMWSGDVLTGGGAPNANWMVMKIAFFNAGGGEISGVENTILNSTFPQNVWINNAPVTGTAPAGTASVQALILFLQPGNDGGSGQVDDVIFTGPPPAMPRYPGSNEDLRLATGVGSAIPSSGAGNDVKQVGGGQLLQVAVSSPMGRHDLQPYFLLGQAFSTATPPTSQSFPGVWFDLNQPFAVLVGVLNGPLAGPVIPPAGASSTFYVTPSGMAGISVLLNAIVFDPAASNFLFASSDAHEIRLQ